MPHTLVLPRELTIYTASETRTDWLTWLAALPEDAPVDGAQVDQVDGAGLQLLVALHHAVVQHGRAWQLSAVSGALHKACLALGAAALLPASEGEAA